MANYMNPSGIDPYAGAAGEGGSLHLQGPLEMLSRLQNMDTAQQMYQQNLQSSNLANLQEAMRTQLQQAQLPSQMNQANYASQLTGSPGYADAYRAQLLSQQFGDIGANLQKYFPAYQQGQQLYALPAAQSKNPMANQQAQQFLGQFGMSTPGAQTPQDVVANANNLGQSFSANPNQMAALGKVDLANQGKADVATIRAQAQLQGVHDRIASVASKLPNTYQAALVRAQQSGDMNAVNEILDLMQRDPSVAGKYDPQQVAGLRRAIDPMYDVKQSLANQMGNGQPQQQPQTQAQSQYPQVTDQASYDKLPKGAMYMSGGKMYQKK